MFRLRIVEGILPGWNGAVKKKANARYIFSDWETALTGKADKVGL
jgi:hypothetical protein